MGKYLSKNMIRKMAGSVHYRVYGGVLFNEKHSIKKAEKERKWLQGKSWSVV